MLNLVLKVRLVSLWWNDTHTPIHAGSVLSIGLTVLSLQYRQLGNLSVGPIGYEESEDEEGGLRPLVVCKRYYKRGTLEPSDNSYDIDAELEHGVWGSYIYVCVCVCVWVGPYALYFEA